MATVETTPTYADLLDLLAPIGDIPPERVLLRPMPGAATEQDVIDIETREGRLCELIDGVLVEKARGFNESRLACLLVYFLLDFVQRHDLGIVAGADGTIRLFPGQVRIPDVCFVAWDRLPGRHYPKEPIPDLAPDLAVEVLSEGNTPREMERKLADYFTAGVRLVWYVEPKSKTVRVYTGVDQLVVLGGEQTLDGGDVLPGFVLPLPRLFAADTSTQP
jgi:Uma2 family endonuclease